MNVFPVTIFNSRRRYWNILLLSKNKYSRPCIFATLKLYTVSPLHSGGCHKEDLRSKGESDFLRDTGGRRFRGVCLLISWNIEDGDLPILKPSIYIRHESSTPIRTYALIHSEKKIETRIETIYIASVA